MRAKPSPSKGSLLPLDTSHATTRARTPAIYWWEPKNNILGAAADSNQPASFMPIRYLQKALVTDGANVAILSVLPRSRR